MNMLVNGEWRTDAYETTNEDGEFERQTTVFRDWVKNNKDAEFPVEENRYHLYVSYACPWAHRTLITRQLKGLEDVISVDIVDPWRGEDGWQFNPVREGCTKDTVNDVDYLRELYQLADDDVTCRVTVPVLWDKEQNTIVNNESEEIIKMLDSEFDELAENNIDLRPESIKEEVDTVIEEIYEPINNGVYRAGFAKSQEAYNNAVDELFNELDRLNEVLGEQRYLIGDKLTLADVCLFTTLVRFDSVYHTHFMCNKKFIHQYDNLWPYVRDIYQTDGVRETVNMSHIKEHYYTTHPEVTPTKIIAAGPNIDFTKKHHREKL